MASRTRSVMNKYLGIGQTMKKSLPSHALRSINSSGFCKPVYLRCPQAEHDRRPSSWIPDSGLAKPAHPVSTISQSFGGFFAESTNLELTGFTSKPVNPFERSNSNVRSCTRLSEYQVQTSPRPHRLVERHSD